jgi:CelD/BcsL family acetyltransferase involved in cellulose biosynthesis
VSTPTRTSPTLGAAAPQVPVWTDILRTSADFLTLEPEWNELLARCRRANPFSTWEWMSSWWEAFGRGREPWVCTARDGPRGRLLAVAPLVVRRHPFAQGPFRELSLMGASIAAGDHLDLLCEAGREAWAADWLRNTLAAHRGQWDVLALDRIVADSPLLDGAWAIARGTPMVWRSVCPYLRFPAATAGQSPVLSRTTRNVRARKRRLVRTAAGNVEFQQVRSEDQLADALDDLFRLHASAGTDRRKRDAFRTADLRRFHRLLASRFLARRWLRLYRLRVGGQTRAVWYGFRWGDTLSLYQTGFDRAWSRFSPGLVLLSHVLDDAFAEGVCEVDFLRGEQAFKFHWTTAVREDLRARFAITLRGQMLVRVYRLAYAIRSQYRNRRSAQPAGCPVLGSSGEEP